MKRDLTMRIEVERLPMWKATMSAAVDLLVAVEHADPALVTDEILDAAANLRASFEGRER